MGQTILPVAWRVRSRQISTKTPKEKMQQMEM